MSSVFSVYKATRYCVKCLQSPPTVSAPSVRCQTSASRRNCRHVAQAVEAAAVEASSAPQVDLQTDYEAVIGIETHVQLATRSKAFCPCKNEYGAPPNTHVCPVCSGQPGALPVLNSEAVRLGILAGLALNCRITSTSKFDRKQYFYPDLPKGYQISQYDEPLCEGGQLQFEWQEEEKRGKKTKKVMRSKSVGITRAHLEEDAGKNVHGGAGGLARSEHSLIDLNRAGVPLLEIVTEPDFRRGIEAAAYGEELRRIVRFLGISDGNMSEGSMRCDVNVSVRPRGQDALGTKVEIKNMNSFRAMQSAIDFEITRQSGLLQEGRGNEIVQETRLFDETSNETFTMRKKEGLADYRYFPEPDLMPLHVSDTTIATVRDSMAELPAAMRTRLIDTGLPVDVVLIIAEDVDTAKYFDAAVAAGADPVQAGNWIQRDLIGWCKETGATMADVKLSPKALAETIALIKADTISSKIAKELLPSLLAGEAEQSGVAALVDERGMGQITDEAAVRDLIQAAMDANPKQLEQFRGGKTKVQGYFQGQVMKESGGRVSPGLLAKILPAMLAGDT